MAKRYDPIMCMMVDEPTKAQDAMPSDLKKAGYEVGTVEKYGSTYYTLVYNGKVISTSPTEANIVEKAKKHYANRHAKAQDEILFYQLRFSSGRTEGAKLDESEIRSYAEALLEKYGEKQVAVSRQGKIVATYFNRKARDELKIVKEDGLWCVYKDGKQVGQSNSEAGAIRIYNRLESGKDSASALDKAIKTTDGMFASIFGKYSSAAKQHYDRAVKELDSFKGEIKDYLTLAGKWEMQIRNDLTRIDEAYNTAGNDYYAARREIQETMDSLTQVMLRKAREKRK